MIKIDKNDSIIDIIIKIKNSNDKQIVLEFPFWHPVLHNYTSLKILKTKAWKKELIINTNDKTSKKIWKKLWIKYSLETKADILDKQYSFWEYFLYTLKNYFEELKIFITKRARENNFAKYQKLYTNWKIWFFTIFLLLSIFLLIFIFYFAVNKTYIHITPEIELRPKWTNFIFQVMWEDELTLDNNVIKLKKIEKEINLKTEILTSWVDEKDSWRARWKVRLKNLLPEEVYLVKNTRLITTSWIVFLLDQDVKIPAALKDESGKEIPWEIQATATSRVDDINWKITWKRWNVQAWLELVLPWLKENSNKISAFTSSNFDWWKDSSKRILSKEDLENAKKILRWKLEQEWLKQVKEELKSENKAKNSDYEILWVKWMINYSDFKFSWLENLKVWQALDSFDISWSLKIIAYTYNKETILNKLKNIIKESTLSNVESILEINEDSFAVVNEIWREENPLRIKATAQIKVYYIQNFLSKKNNFIEKIKKQIAWLSKEEAEKILINTWVVSSVNIEIRPFFIKNISKIVDNIKFEIN